MKGRTLTRMLRYTKPYKGLLAGAILGALLSVPLALIGPVLIGRAVDHVLGPGQVDFTAIAKILAALLLTGAASCLLQWLMGVCTRKISALAAQDMRRDLFAQMNRLPLKAIDGTPQGDLVSRLVNDADAVAEGLLQGLTQLIPGAVTILATIGVMLALNVPIALLVIVVTPLSIVFARFVSRRTAKYFRRQSAAQGALAGITNEMVTQQALVRAFGYEEASAAEFEAANLAFSAGYEKATFYSSVANPGTRFVNALVYAAVGVFGAISAVNGGISVGGLSAFLSYANQYTKPFNEVTSVLTQLQNAFASAERMFKVMDWPAETPDREEDAAPTHAEGDVRCEEVYFSYVEDRPLIQDFNLHARCGQRIALVGPTGCGKTTLINLLMRFYEIDAGVIRVDGMPADHIKRGALRALYGMVLQETWLKQATVRENIAYGRPTATDAEVENAARAAYAHSFIKRLPQGYDTIIAPGGGNLSAGQKQLLCIARIILAKPDMLILDEATSSIDTRTEMLIGKALDALMEGHTSFVVAHRLSTIQNADTILVMKAGRIIERGTHTELLAQNGFYAGLYQSQFKVE